MQFFANERSEWQGGRALRMTGCRSVINEVAEAYAKE